jgi:hypothetical protein
MKDWDWASLMKRGDRTRISERPALLSLSFSVGLLYPPSPSRGNYEKQIILNRPVQKLQDYGRQFEV